MTGDPKVLDGAKDKVLVVKLKGAMDSLKVTFTVLLVQMAKLSSAGLTSVTVGTVVSSASAVLKVQTVGATKGLPAKSVAALLTVAVKAVLLAKRLVGVKVAVRAPTA